MAPFLKKKNTLTEYVSSATRNIAAPDECLTWNMGYIHKIGFETSSNTLNIDHTYIKRFVLISLVL